MNANLVLEVVQSIVDEFTDDIELTVVEKHLTGVVILCAPNRLNIVCISIDKFGAVVYSDARHNEVTKPLAQELFKQRGRIMDATGIHILSGISQKYGYHPFGEIVADVSETSEQNETDQQDDLWDCWGELFNGDENNA